MKNVKRVLAVVLTALVILTCFAACGAKPEKLIIGQWRDSTGVSGYDFREDGSCTITFLDVNVPLLGSSFTGDAVGTYTLTEVADDVWNVKIIYTIYSKSITKEFKVDVTESSLTLTNIETGEATVYLPYTAPETTVSTTAA